MWDYVFGRLMYNFIKLIGKGFYYFFVGIVWVMYYSVFYACMALYILCKLSVSAIIEFARFVKKSLIKLKERNK